MPVAVAITLATVALGLTAVVVVVRMTSTPRPVVRVELSQFTAEWRANPAATVEKYRDSNVELSGVVRLVGSTLDGTPYLLIGPGPSSSFEQEVQLLLYNDRLIGKLKDYPPGTPITVKARFEDIDTRPIGRAIAFAPR